MAGIDHKNQPIFDKLVTYIGNVRKPENIVIPKKSSLCIFFQYANKVIVEKRVIKNKLLEKNELEVDTTM